MRFFDNKSEVIDIQLTQKGKRLLSEGKFKPKFYSFYDNNIIYDSNYVGISENQNDTERRIKEETVLLHTQHNFGEVGKSDSDVPLLTVNEFILQLPISENTDLGTKKAPQWDVLFYGGTLLTASGHYTGSNEIPVPITQIEMSQEYTLIPVETSLLGTGPESQPANIARMFFDDGTTFAVISDDIIAHVLEKNTPYENENFDIEVYKFEDSGSMSKIKKLDFVRETVYIKNGILLSEPIFVPDDLVITEDFVEYYFNINVDNQITTEDLCRAVKKLKAQDIYLESEFECPDEFDPIFADIYKSATEAEDTEICDDNVGPCD